LRFVHARKKREGKKEEGNGLFCPPCSFDESLDQKGKKRGREGGEAPVDPQAGRRKEKERRGGGGKKKESGLS